MIYVVLDLNEWEQTIQKDMTLFSKFENALECYNEIKYFNISKTLYSFENDVYTIIREEKR